MAMSRVEGKGKGAVCQAHRGWSSIPEGGWPPQALSRTAVVEVAPLAAAGPKPAILGFIDQIAPPSALAHRLQ